MILSRVRAYAHPPNQFTTYEKALIFIVRENKKVIERSIQKFTSKSEYIAFKKMAKESLLEDENLELYICHLREAQPPEGKAKRISQAWCPYCMGWRSYISSNGYKKCEICLRSTADFYWKKYNARAPITVTPTASTSPVTDDEKREKRRARREKRKKAREAK